MTKPYDPFIPAMQRATESIHRFAQAFTVPRATALPWGDQDLAEVKMAAIKSVYRLRRDGAPLEMHTGGMTSDPNLWQVSQDRADQMLKDIVLWEPAEGVLPQHRAEAIRIVYEGLLRAGMVPPAARRPVQSRLRV